jgi:hypothetical protein
MYRGPAGDEKQKDPHAGLFVFTIFLDRVSELYPQVLKPGLVYSIFLDAQTASEMRRSHPLTRPPHLI